MATYTDNYSLTKPTFAEVADIRTINGNMDTIDDIMHASQVSLADAYDQTATYNTGDVVMYEFLMYKCKEDNVTGNWDATKWERTTAAETGGEASDLSVKVPEVISTGDKACYVKRAIPTAGALAEGQKIVGATLAWNQLVDTGTTSVTIARGHKYIKYSGGTYTKGTSDGTAISVSNGDLFFDITQMFGSTIADSLTVEQFSSLFPNSSYAYDAGSLQSVNVSAHKAVGKNKLGCTLTALKTRNSTATWTDNKALINGVTFTVNTTSDGYISDISASGTAGTGNSQLIVPIDSNSVNGDVYYVAVYNGGTSTFHAYAWDSTTNSRAKQWNGTTNVYDSNNGTLQQLKIIKGHTVEIPLRVMASQTANNWMFYPMITSPTETDATFKPYWQTNVILDSSKEFRGLYQLVSGELRADGDVYESDGTVTRKYGMAILDGSDDENWSVSGNNKRVNSNYLNNSKYFPVSTVANIISSRFNAVSAENTYNGIRGISLSDTLNVSDGSGNMNLNEWKTNLSTNPLVVVYELATTTTESATPYTNPQLVDADGTEEFVDYKVSQGTRDVAIPVGHESDFYDYTDGTITIPDLPFADGTYALSVTMNNGTPTFSWEGGN